MRRSRIFFVLVLVFLLWCDRLPLRVSAQQLANQVVPTALPSSVATMPGALPIRKAPNHEGIKEVISDKYKTKYQAWKDEFLSTETGRSEWETFQQNDGFTLVITVSSDEHSGAGTGKYEWNDQGQLVSATITLGTHIDTGYPNPIYYPVMNALAYSEPSLLNGNILAAAKIAHEFGHVREVTHVDPTLYRLQNQLIPQYNKILLSNGRNTQDPRLLEMAKRMAGTPVEIWEDREYWGEANAMLYLRDRYTKKSEQRALFTRIIKSVELYAGNYAERFDRIAQ